jgi:hypothetical protein
VDNAVRRLASGTANAYAPRTTTTSVDGVRATRPLAAKAKTKYDAVMAELIGEDVRRSNLVLTDAAGPTSGGVVASSAAQRTAPDSS